MLLRNIILFSIRKHVIVLCISSQFHLVAANIFTLKLLHWLFLSLSFSPPLSLSLSHNCVCVCVSFLALAKKTKASILPCVWTKSSTSPLSWTLLWLVNSRYIIKSIQPYVVHTIQVSLHWFIPLPNSGN